ncbi:MAG: response regulator [Verrucomicrobiota bacterium]
MAKVLLVDDDPAMLRFLSRTLSECGHETLEALDGLEALDLLSVERPDLVVADLLMPVMDGFELVFRIRSTPAIASTRVIFFTGAFYRAEVRTLAESAGVRRILTKPATGQEVQQAVSETLLLKEMPVRPLPSEFARQHHRILVGKIAAAELAQKTAEEARRASERRSRALFEHSLDAILFASDSGRYIDANPAACDLLGYTLEELLGMSVSDLVAGSASTEQWNGFLSMNKQRGECQLRCKNGSRVDVEFGAVTHIEPGVHLSILRDITVRKQSEEALRESEQKLNLAIAASDLGVWDWDIAGNKFIWSDRCKSMFGLGQGSRDDLEAFASAIHPDDRAAVHAAISRAHEEKTAYSIEYRVVWPDGSIRWIAARGRATYDADGKPLRGTGTAHDITEQKRLERQFLRADRMESLGTLAGGIAHDLNNVLAPIILSVELLRQRVADTEGHATLEVIEKSARRGVEMVRQVLAFARGVEGERLLISAQALIEEVRKIIVDTFPKNIVIRCALAPDLWKISGNLTQLHQVLINLCVNARDAMPNGGQLLLSAENVLLEDQPGSQLHAGPHLLLQVCDDGNGIAPSILDNIFDPFFTTKEFGKGTGLGLSTSLGIIHSHDGIITVASEPGKGTSFKIYLPARITHDIDSPTEVRQEKTPRAEGQLIMVVDDEEPIREITRQILENAGYSVVAAVDGAEACKLYRLQHDRIAVVITDMMMPVMDGPSTIHRLREINPKVKIIGASGLPATDHNASLNYFLHKPYSQETLLQTVARALQSAFVS